jgi:site-specific recombinase XerD
MNNVHVVPTRSLQAWLGHRNIQHTVRYTELAPNRFRAEIGRFEILAAQYGWV